MLFQVADLVRPCCSLTSLVYEGFYNFSDICIPVDLFTPSLYKFDVTGKDIEDNHTMEHEAQKRKLFYL